MGYQVEFRTGPSSWCSAGSIPFGRNDFPIEADAAHAADSLTEFIGLEFRVKPPSTGKECGSFWKAASRHFRSVARRSMLLEVGYLAQAEADALRYDPEKPHRPKVMTTAEHMEFDALVATRRAAWIEAELLPNGASRSDLVDRYAELQADIDAREDLAHEITDALILGAILVSRKHTAGPFAMGYSDGLFSVISDPGMVLVEVATEGDEFGPVVQCPECGAKKRHGCVDPHGKETKWHRKRVEAGMMFRTKAMRSELDGIQFLGSIGRTIAGHKVAHAGKAFVSIDGKPAMLFDEAADFLVQEELRFHAAQRIAETFIGERGARMSEARIALERWCELREMGGAP